jgi:hypothetical protein
MLDDADPGNRSTGPSEVRFRNSMRKKAATNVIFERSKMMMTTFPLSLNLASLSKDWRFS